MRHAVSLYHLTPSFYPTNVSGDKDPVLENEVTESILGPFYNGRSGRPFVQFTTCLLYTSPSPRDKRQSRMPSSA